MTKYIVDGDSLEEVANAIRGVILDQREAEQPKPEPPAFKPYSVQVTTPRGLNVRKSASTSSQKQR